MSVNTNQKLKGISADIDRIVLAEAEIQDRVKALGASITADFGPIVSKESPLIVVGVLKGVIVFLSDLLRQIDLPVEVHFIDIASFSGNIRESGYRELNPTVSKAIRGKHVLFVEDIIDEGLTLSYLMRLLWQKDPASISACSLLSRDQNRLMELDIRYVGFSLSSNTYLVGYGLDSNELYRNLPFIGVLKS